MNKNFATNVVALALALLGVASPWHSEVIVMTGLFALSGGITNWLAVHMLFEKIPLIYGSGVVPLRFDDFRHGIKMLLLNEFFSREHIARFLAEHDGLSASVVSAKIDRDKVFESLADAIEQSPMGSMLGMLGGRQALEPLREPVGEKLNELIAEVMNGADDSLADTLATQVEDIVERRLAELTPHKVKQIVEDMIRQHLGWLVVWGGIFGGLIGLVTGIVRNL